MDTTVWGFQGSREGEGSDSLPKKLVPNGHVTKCNLYLTRHGTLGKYFDIWEICAYTFELGAGRIVQMHQILY